MEENEYYEEYNEEPTYHSYKYNEPNNRDDWYEADQMED